MTNSRSKGKRGELEWAKWLRINLGVEARRGQQFCGGGDSPDVVCDLPIHWEVKRVEHLNLDNAMKQATFDCPVDKIPVVAHRKNNGQWMITVAAEFLPALAMAAYQCSNKQTNKEYTP